VLNQALLGLFPNIQVAFIYGSVAKGLETANSDIDLMLIGNVSNQEVLTALEPVQITLARKINPTIYTLEEIAQRYNSSTPFVLLVLEQAKIFIKGSEVQLNKLLLTVKF
jgi:predicted nucleotidyltransferase